jgi:hypothetical protein
MHITQQGHLYKERTIANGDDFYVNYIVRKTPFEITLSCDTLSFFQKKLDCKLLYHGSDKVVESNSGPAIAYVCSPCEDFPTTCIVSFRINVLSTQHANSLFTIKFTLENFVIFSEPIRAVSKPEQIRKKLAQCDPAENRIPVDEKNKKRARSEELLEALSCIQQSQQQQTNLITALLNRNANSAPPVVHANSALPVLTLEDSLDSLLNVFGPQVNDRPMKLARYVENLNPEKKNALTKMSQFFLSFNEPTSPSGKFLEEYHYSPFSPSGEFSSDLSSDDANVMGMEQETYQWFSSF